MEGVPALASTWSPTLCPRSQWHGRQAPGVRWSPRARTRPHSRTALLVENPLGLPFIGSTLWIVFWAAA